ncbi:hypothetical protein [Streptomyces liliifuscus]|uniref:Uncharacterized protein n=1 Tax=Streptomyces liliifuscus TaxID=2797636 RepID=A0A7T7I210_9ACTN|nr:hypothetical protein [Streptomyces liliifuscus]QQM39267.1 hypothetical protein JEQ17_07175 [Streptomyces liliifuscus]
MTFTRSPPGTAEYRSTENGAKPQANLGGAASFVLVADLMSGRGMRSHGEVMVRVATLVHVGDVQCGA